MRRKDVKKCLLKGVVSLWSVREPLQTVPPSGCSTACFNTDQVRWSLSPPPPLLSMCFMCFQVCLFHCVSPAGYTCLSSLCPACAELSVCQAAPCQVTALTRLPYRKAHCCWLQTTQAGYMCVCAWQAGVKRV